MSQSLTERTRAIKNTPGTGELVQIAEINSAFDKFDNHFIPKCKLRNSNASQIVGSGVGQVQLIFNQILIDTYAARSEGPMADTANNRIIIRKAGLYRLRVNTLVNAGTAGMLRLDMAINGNTNNSQFDTGQTATATSQTLETEEILAANDVITAFYQQTTGSNRTLTNNTYNHIFNLEAVWLGSAVEV